MKVVEGVTPLGVLRCRVSPETERPRREVVGLAACTVEPEDDTDAARFRWPCMEDRSNCETSESERRVRVRKGLGEAEDLPRHSDISSGMLPSCQLILTFSVKRLRMVNKLETVPPEPT